MSCCPSAPLAEKDSNQIRLQTSLDGHVSFSYVLFKVNVNDYQVATSLLRPLGRSAILFSFYSFLFFFSFTLTLFSILDFFNFKLLASSYWLPDARLLATGYKPITDLVLVCSSPLSNRRCAILAAQAKGPIQQEPILQHRPS